MSAADSRTDAELVDAANAGDVSAFETLYLRYRDWVVSVAIRWCGTRDEAMDVAQEVFLWLLKLFPGFELRAQMKTVLYPVIRNTALTRRRRDQTRSQHDRTMSSFILPIGATDPSPHPEIQNRLAILLSELPRLQFEVLVLRFVDGLSLQEIAEAVDIPLGTVKSRLHHAVLALRSDPCLRDLFDET